MVAQITAQRTDNHRDMLIGMAGADIVDIAREGCEESRTVETVGGLQQTSLLGRVGYHFRQAGQGFADTAYLTGDVHVPHLIAVTRFGPAFILCTLFLHKGTIVHTVPNPQSHVFGNQKCLVS